MAVNTTPISSIKSESSYLISADPNQTNGSEFPEDRGTSFESFEVLSMLK
jgi:hypothetical protein